MPTGPWVALQRASLLRRASSRICVDALRREVLVVLVVELDHRALPARREALGGEQRELAVRRGLARVHAELLLEVVLDVPRAHELAAQRAAHPDHVAPGRLLLEQRVERHHALHVGGRQPELLGDVCHHLRRDVPVLLLAQVQQRDRQRLTGWVPRQELLKEAQAFWGELEGHGSGVSFWWSSRGR
jgi:hypothetical protein